MIAGTASLGFPGNLTGPVIAILLPSRSDRHALVSACKGCFSVELVVKLCFKLTCTGHSDLYPSHRIMTFDRFLGEFKRKLKFQTFFDHYGRWCSFVNLLGLTMLFIALPAQGQSTGTHTTLEQVNQAVRETQRLCEDQIEKGAVPGLAIAVVLQDQVVYAAGLGVRDVNTREPVNADTVFQLASLSKAVGSTVVAELVGEGKISWDSRISDLDPEFAK
jgi:Beta-lactamase